MTNKGDTVKLIHTQDQYTNLKPGDEGVVQCVDGMGTVHVLWNNGSHLGLVPGEDQWYTNQMLDDEAWNVLDTASTDPYSEAMRKIANILAWATNSDNLYRMNSTEVEVLDMLVAVQEANDEIHADARIPK